MWKLNVIILLLSISCVICGPAKKEVELPTTTSSADLPSDPSPAPPTTSAPFVAEVTEAVATVAEETSQEPKPPKPHSNRRVITYDQRQEGEYNVRADLENFVILVVPSKKSSGLSLLDLLTRSAIRSQAKNALKKQQQFAVPSTDESKQDEQQKAINTHAQFAGQQFIEGRTPYKVDISSTAQKVPRYSPETRSVEILPYQQYGARSAMLNLRPPSQMPFDSQPTGFLYPSHQGNMIGSYPTFSSSRQTKSLAESDLADSNNSNNFLNSLTLVDNLTDDGDGGYDNENLDYLPNLGYLDLSDTENSFDSLNVGNVDRMSLGGSAYYGEDDELKLIGAEEQCGPDRRRDSYGVCQFIENGDI